MIYSTYPTYMDEKGRIITNNNMQKFDGYISYDKDLTQNDQNFNNSIMMQPMNRHYSNSVGMATVDIEVYYFDKSAYEQLKIDNNIILQNITNFDINVLHEHTPYMVLYYRNANGEVFDIKLNPHGDLHMYNFTHIFITQNEYKRRHRNEVIDDILSTDSDTK